MDLELLRELANALPYVTETVQWGDNLLFWVGDKSVGGKMFAMANMEAGGKCVVAMAAGAEGMAELCERDGIVPAPYLARVHWVCMERWDALTTAEWNYRLALAHRIITAKLPKRTRELLEMPAKVRARAVRHRKAVRKSRSK